MQRSQSEVWNELVGEAWVQHAAIHDRQAEPFGLAALDALGDVSGASVLDVGCGTGATTRQLIDRGAASVVGVDISRPMIEAAQAAATGTRIRFEVADALQFAPPEPFDVIFSRFGVMFFDDPIAAFTHLRSYTSARGRIGFCCWGPPAGNPMMTLPVAASASVLGPPSFAARGEPGPFSLASDETVREVLSESGWSDIAVAELAVDAAHPAGDAAAVADMVLDFNPLLVDGIRRHPERRAAARAAIIEALSGCEREGTVCLESQALIVTAKA